ncbi:unnamed protein product [Fraxinus pennsylvanica]|uniref:Aminotransferase class I/classII large domain-containing protein n=1 Tax=Fraxinus pennsylvanica TaxID=56036 RepID=A0AAD2DVU3_9LAMI|nr:unnamed protein product [Fraxinus pennsylvanica]
MQKLDVDPLTDIVICCGQSEAFAATIFAIVEQGDEVILFDPSYETYETCIRLAGGVPVYVALDPPNWTLNLDKLKKSFTTKTKAVVLNRYSSFISAVIEAGSISLLFQLLNIAELEIKKEAAWTISNTVAGGTSEQIKFLVHEVCIKQFLLCWDPLTITKHCLVQDRLMEQPAFAIHETTVAASLLLSRLQLHLYVHVQQHMFKSKTNLHANAYSSNPHQPRPQSTPPTLPRFCL